MEVGINEARVVDTNANLLLLESQEVGTLLLCLRGLYIIQRSCLLPLVCPLSKQEIFSISFNFPGDFALAEDGSACVDIY